MSQCENMVRPASPGFESETPPYLDISAHLTEVTISQGENIVRPVQVLNPRPLTI
ncbi:hypothetical protein DPMN_124955 [Dreissena polymorpha]|uniref:Uncharacterized protein n=1 Tax=Dreissena polymorpha TaxID=45954 RepID=A0A9D4GT29_DREPO|nr:hypothetical protein DPMN_124955 [Dreissena polymorpha]